MAFLKNIVIAASLLAPLVVAAPMIDERALHTHTMTETVWTTIEEVTTVWIEPGAATQAPEAANTTVATTSAPGAVIAQATAAPGASTFETSVAAPSTDISSAVVPAPSAAVAAPSTAIVSIEASSAASPVVVSSSAAAATSSAVANVATDSTGPTAASASADCEGKGDACVGDVTHWDGGLGACGWTVDTSSDMEIALPYEFMGTLSNSNPYCGRSVTLYNPTSGTTVSAKVGDKCMGCVDRAIDCTDALFTAITDGKGDGRMSGIQWWLN